MNPETIALLIGYATKYGIPAAIEIVKLFKVKDATPADVIAAFARSHKSYEEYEGVLPEGVEPLPNTTG